MGRLLCKEINRILDDVNQTFKSNLVIEDLLKSFGSGNGALELGLIGGAGTAAALIGYGIFAVTGYALVVETTTLTAAGAVAAVSTVTITAAAMTGIGIAVVGVGAGIWAIVKAAWKRKTAIKETTDYLYI